MWIVQEYEGAVHVVPDTEPGHVLDAGCFCEPERDAEEPAVIVHRDGLDRQVSNVRPPGYCN